MKKTIFTLIALFGLSITAALANKTAVEVKAPAEVKAGTEITITITVTHKGNSKTHHTDWVYLKINGKEVQKWEYTKTKLPENDVFTVEYKIIASESLTIEAEGHCNIHGTAGPETATVNIAG